MHMHPIAVSIWPYLIALFLESFSKEILHLHLIFRWDWWFKGWVGSRRKGWLANLEISCPPKLMNYLLFKKDFQLNSVSPFMLTNPICPYSFCPSRGPEGGPGHLSEVSWGGESKSAYYKIEAQWAERPLSRQGFWVESFYRGCGSHIGRTHRSSQHVVSMLWK